MRFDVPLISAVLFGATAHAAAVHRRDLGTDQRGAVHDQIEQIDQEIERLEAELAKDLSELEAGQYHRPGHPQPFQPAESSSSSSLALLPSVASSTPSSAAASTSSFASSTPVSYSSAAQSSGSAAPILSPSSFSLTSSISTSAGPYGTGASSTLSTSSANPTSVLQSLSSVAASLSSVISSVSTDIPTDGTTTLVTYSSSNSGSTIVVVHTATVIPYSPVKSTASSYGIASSSASVAPVASANSTSAFLSGTATMAPAPLSSLSSNVTSSNVTTSCSALCSSLTFSSDLTVTPYTCEQYSANSTLAVPSGQSTVGCGTSETPSVPLCRVTLEITTSSASSVYMEVWLPNGNSSSWNGRTMSTDNGGLNGCVAYDNMAYVAGMGFAAIGDNGGHNSSAYDGTAFSNNNEAVLDWAYRARHESTTAGKEVVKQFYGEEQSKAYYVGCSTGGQQGLHSAQYFPDDFDGIIAGSAAADFNHLEDWSARFLQLTGNDTDPRFLTEDQWIFVQSYLFAQCDAALDGVDDGIIEDPTICEFDYSAIPVCSGNTTDNCLTDDQVTTVYNVFTELYNTDGELLYPSLLYGSQVDAFRLGQLSGTTQGIAHDWFAYGVYNNSNFDVANLDQTDYAYADSLDAYHGNVSSFSGDLSAFQAAGKKMIMYHGMADPLVSGGNSQRYYLKVAKTLGISDNTEMDPFLRLFRISGMAHCGVGGISGAGAWMFGQNSAADLEGVTDNIIDNLVNWVENDDAPDTITGTKFNYDLPSLGVSFRRPHCRFPYRTTYESGDWWEPTSWGCTFIDDWQECGVGAHPRLCNEDGTFT